MEEPAWAAADREQDAGGEATGDDAAHPVGEERQRHAFGRQQSERHARVDDRFQRKKQRDTEREVAAEGVGRRPRGLEAAPGDYREERKHDCDADETDFLTDYTKYKIGVRSREEEQLLVAFAETDAERSARAEAEQRLDRLISVPLRVLPRIEEGQDPLQPVRRAPDQERRDRRQRADDAEQVGRASARDEEERKRQHRQHDRGAEIRLEQEQHGKQPEHHQVRQKAD